MGFALGLLLFISISINIALAFGIYRGIKNVEVAEDALNDYTEFLEQMRKQIQLIINAMRTIDIKGTYASGIGTDGAFLTEDDVGGVFKQMLGLVELLGIFLTQKEQDGTINQT